MIENVLRNLGGIAVFGIISVCLFFVFFNVMLAWAASLKKPYIESMQTLPLQEDQPAAEPSNSANHE